MPIDNAHRNAAQAALGYATEEAQKPSEEEERTAFGKITKVRHKDSKVKVEIATGTGGGSDTIPVKGWLPLVTPMSFIVNQFGSLRPGLAVEIKYRGKEQVKNGRVYVLGDRDLDFNKQEPQDNKLETGVVEIFGGGLIG